MSFTSQIPQALLPAAASLRRPHRSASAAIASHLSRSDNAKPQKVTANIVHSHIKKLASAIQLGAAFATIELPALAHETGMNYEEDLTWTLIQSGIVGTWYFLLMPPIIMNWLRIRWYKRNLLEMYFQFMFVFLFFPGVMLWAPFLNFRKFPRDPDMKYPWSKPEDPDRIKAGFYKYPNAEPEEYV